jgi:hypothetical protein
VQWYRDLGGPPLYSGLGDCPNKIICLSRAPKKVPTRIYEGIPKVDYFGTLRLARTTRHPYSPEYVEGEFSEVRLLRGYALRYGSWHHTHRWEGFDPLGS